MTGSGCLRIALDHYPGLNPFVRDWLRGEKRATNLLAREARPRSERARRSPEDSELVAALDASNRRWGLFVKDQLQQWASGQSVTLVAGQQVGFAGGPLYTLAKIASLVKMKRELESAGTPATIFFWLATEDHDFDEVAKVALPVSTIQRDIVNRQLDVLTVSAARSFESKSVVGRLPLPEVLITELLALYGLARPQWLREGISFGDSFAELIASVFGAEVILVDSLLPELRRAGAPLFNRIAAEWTSIQESLRERALEVKAAGYEPQVTPREDGDYTLLFEIDGNGDRHIVESPRAIAPEKVSTSALTRPLLQDFVLQPDVFLGGPAEVAYYAQIAPLHRLLNIAAPRVALRGHVLLAPKRVVRFVERFEIGPEEMFTPPDELLASRESKEVAAVRRLTADGNRELVKTIEQIGELALPAEHSLARAINRSVGHIEYHFNKLAERAVKGIVRKDRDRWAAARELAATIRPDGHVQDRVVAWFPYWLTGEKAFIDRLIEEVEPDTDSFKVVSI